MWQHARSEKLLDSLWSRIEYKYLPDTPHHIFVRIEAFKKVECVYFSNLKPLARSSVLTRAVTAQNVIHWTAPAIPAGIMNIHLDDFATLKKENVKAELD
jgi:hypothetical protein